MNLRRNALLYRRIKTAVAQAMPERASELDKIMGAYDGNPRILFTFLQKFGSDNPWEAAKNAYLRQAIFRAPQESTREILGVSESGHKLTEQLFVLTHTYDPTRVWRSGSRAILKILEAFGTPAQQEQLTPEGQQRLKAKKNAQGKAALRDFVGSLEEVLLDPSRISDIQGRNERLQVQKILDVDALRQRILSLDTMLYGNTAFVDDLHPSYLLAMDKGGTLFGWFKRRFNELPIAIRDIYTTVVNPIVDSNEQDRKFMVGALLAYAAANMPVRREAIVGGYQQDLDFMMKLPENDPLIKKYGRPDLMLVRNILKQKEITLLDATRVFDAFPIDRVRQEVNHEHYQRYAAEVESILEKLQPLFIHDGKWHEDSLGASVPLARLKETPYFTCLQREDFLPVMNFLRVQTIAPTPEKTYQALPLQQFHHTIDAIVIAGRKVRAFNELQTDAAGNRTAGKIIRGQEYDLRENFEATHALPLDEFLQRVDYLHQKKHIHWGPLRQKMQEEARYGLYSKPDVESLQPILEEAKSLRRYEDIRNFAEAADKLLSHPLVKPGKFRNYGLLPDSSNIFIEPAKVEFLTRLLQTGSQLRAIDLKYGDSLPTILQRREQWEHARLYSLQSAEKKFAVTWTLLEYDEPTKDIGCGVYVLDLEVLQQTMDTMDKEYVSVKNLPEHWKERVHYLVSRNAEPLLRGMGMSISDTVTWRNIQDLQEHHYIHQELVEEAEKLYGRMEKQFSYIQNSISSGREELEQAALYDGFNLKIVGNIGNSRRFRQEFGRRFYHHASQGWIASSWEYKGSIGDLTRRIRDYNAAQGTKITLEVTKREI